MRRTLAFLLLVLAGGQLARTQSNDVTTEQEIETVDFCDLFRHTDRYDGKTVKVTATYVVGLHEATFLDDTCKESRTDRHLEANAKFTGDSSGTVEAFKKLSKFLKKHKASEARVTMVAVFRDDYSSGVVQGGRSRYTLDVKQLLAVEKAKPPAATNPKNQNGCHGIAEKSTRAASGNIRERYDVLI